MEKKEYKPKNMYHPSGVVRFANSEEECLAFEKRGYSDKKIKPKSKSTKNGKEKSKNIKKDVKKD